MTGAAIFMTAFTVIVVFGGTIYCLALSTKSKN